MKQYIIIPIIFLSYALSAQEIVNFNKLAQRCNNDNDTIYVINYWATWCQPCVEELPEFIKLEKEMKGQKFKMILVSLDFPKHIESRVKPFLKSNKITTEVVILDDDANVWINLVNPEWAGEIPATQVIKNDKKEFYGEQLSYEQLKNIVTTFQ